MSREDRLKQFFALSGLSQVEFAERMGVSQQIISDVFREKKKAGEKILLGIMDNISGVNPIWLFVGKGEMKMGKAQSLNKKESLEDIILERIYETIGGREEKTEQEIAKLSLELKSLRLNLRQTIKFQFIDSRILIF